MLGDSSPVLIGRVEVEGGDAMACAYENPEFLNGEPTSVLPACARAANMPVNRDGLDECGLPTLLSCGVPCPEMVRLCAAR